ncbi:MAG: hypothetical protein Q9195_004168 [Heterodermia aff. obscurata]
MAARGSASTSQVILEGPPQKNRGSPRIYKEAANMQKDPPPGCSAGIVGDNMHHWAGIIDGPEDSVYAQGKFHFKMLLPPNYPYDPPMIRFQSKIYHPNIKSTSDHKDGYPVCIDILQKDQAWTPMITIDKILVSVRSLFTDPNPDHPMELEIAREYKNDRATFERKAREYTEKYAMEK